jgi:hypothetical protein
MEGVGYFWVLLLALVGHFVASLAFCVFAAHVSGVYSGRVSDEVPASLRLSVG